MYRTTKKDFQEFRTEALRTVARLGINDWVVDFDHTKTKEWRGCCYADHESRCACLKLSTHGFDEKPSRLLLRHIAKHEVAHLLTAALANRANSRWCTEAEVTEAQEAVCNRIANAL